MVILEESDQFNEWVSSLDFRDYTTIQLMRMAWEASRECVEVELPTGSSNMTAGALHMIVRCREALTNAGVTVK